MGNEYHKQGADFLEKFGITMEWVCLGDCCPKFCKDAGDGVGNEFPRRNHIHGKQHAITFKRQGKQFQIMYWNSYKDEELLAFFKKPRLTHSLPFSETKLWTNPDASLVFLRPSKAREAKALASDKIKAYDVLACLTKYEPGSFKNFCGEYGYDTDSISARDTWQAICEEWEKVSGFFTKEELEELQEIN